VKSVYVTYDAYPYIFFPVKMRLEWL